MNEKKELQQECKNTTEDRTQDSIKKEWWQEEKTNHQMANNVRKARWKEKVHQWKELKTTSMGVVIKKKRC